MRVRALVLMAFVTACPGTASAGKADVYALVGARVFPVSGPVLEGATVVLRDGLIEAVGAGIAPPPDARVIDAKGLCLSPGLIDGFGGVGLPGAPARGAASEPPAAGAAAPTLKPQAMALDRLRPADALRARDEGVTTALAIGREGVLPGQSVIVNLAGDRAEAMALRQPAFLHLHMTTLRREYPSSLMGTMAYARQALLDAGHYRDAWAAYEKAPRGKPRPRYDAALAAWQEVLAGRQTLLVTASRENDVRRALALADEFRLRLAVAGAPQAHRLAALIRDRKLPLLVTVNFDPPRAAGFGGPFGGGADEEREKRDIDEAETNPADLHKAGVSFALVSGYAPSFLAGIRKAVERGLPAEAALRAVTLAAAEALGIADRTGSLEPGKLANLVAWSGEPLAKDARVKLVFVDGQLYEPDEEPRREGGPPGRPAPGTQGDSEVIR